MTYRFRLTCLLVIALFGASGCSVNLIDRTQSPAPPTRNATYTVVVEVERGFYVTSVDKPRVNIDGTWFGMQSIGNGRWEHSTQLPPTSNSFGYQYEVKYTYNTSLIPGVSWFTNQGVARLPDDGTSLQFQLDVPGPDLVVDAISVLPASPAAGAVSTIQITLRNAGTISAGASNLSVIINGGVSRVIPVAGIPSGGNITQDLMYVFASAGPVNITAEADANGDVSETSETNNTASKSVTIGSCVPASDLKTALAAAQVAFENGATQVDLDGDCSFEYTRTFDSGGVELREEIDTNGDGVANIVWDKTGTPKTYRSDADQDGTPEVELLATPDSSNPNIVSYIRTWDKSGDGIPDWRILYTIDPSSSTFNVEHESDADQDGNFDAEYETEANTVQEVDYDFETSGPNACNSTQQANINSAFDDMLNEGTPCLLGMDTRMAMNFLRTLGKHKFRFSCVPGASFCARATDYHNMDNFVSLPDPVRIEIDSGFASGGTCSEFSLKEVIFHEVLHYSEGNHEIGNGTQDPGDRMYGCQKTCFGIGTSITCAACVGEKNGSSKCGGYPPEACLTSPTYCRCNGQVYSTPATCGGSCPVNLGCFAFQCKELGPCAN